MNCLDSSPQKRHKDSRFPVTPPTRKGAVSHMPSHLGRREHLTVLACVIALLLGPTLIGPAVSSAQAQTGAITGKITDESGVGVPYANVFIKGTQLGGMANAEGKFTIVNGIASRNPLRAEGVDLGLLAVSSSEQVLGGLDAQYGNALSGVINLTTREGGDKFGGEIRYFTDRYGEVDKSFNNFERVSTGFGGPFLFPKTNYFISFEGTYTDTYLRNVATHKEHRSLDFIRLGNRQSNDATLSTKLTFKLTPNEKLNVEIIKNRALDGEYQNRWNRQGWVQVRQDSTAPTDGNVTTRYGAWSYFQVDSSYVPMNTAEHLPVTDEDYLQTAITWKHTLGVGTVYNLRASRQEWQTTTDVLDRMPWEYQQLPNNYYDVQNRLDGPYYVTNGDYPFYERKQTTTYTFNGDCS